MIYDKYGRPILSMRISVTQRCNLKCIYCHREGISEDENDNREMHPDEIERIVKIGKKFGVKKVKITGGEPLVREDICEIVERIARIGFDDVSMTTNGVYLEDYARDLRKAGLDRVNVSLDTLRREVYKSITGSDFLEKVVNGIEEAYKVGLKPIKINVVMMRGINDDELENFFKRFSRKHIIIQLIELMKSNIDNNFFEKHFYSLENIENFLSKHAKKIILRRRMQARRKYILNGVEVEVVRPMHNTNFCANCTRIRVTADGKFKPCLMRNDNLVDFLTPMRNGASDEELEELFKKAVMLREPYFKQ